MADFNKRMSFQRRMRKSQETIANSLIAMADLLEVGWGKWKVKDGALVFDDDKDAENYNVLAQATMKAEEEQVIAQREMIKLQQIELQQPK